MVSPNGGGSEAATSADIIVHRPEPADLIALYAALEPNDER